MFLQLEWRVKLYPSVNEQQMQEKRLPTCDSGINGGPKAMSAALVPGRILRVEPSSPPEDPIRILSPSGLIDSPADGDCGPIWTSGNGGGLGRRGELDGETPAAVMACRRGTGGARGKTKDSGKIIKE